MKKTFQRFCTLLFIVIVVAVPPIAAMAWGQGPETVAGPAVLDAALGPAAAGPAGAMFAPAHPEALPLFWEEDFSAPISPTTYYITATAGSGLVDSGSFLLTQNAGSERGRILYLTPTLMTEFSATFRLYLGSSDGGADGAAFLFCPAYDYPPGVGGSMDATCPGGYIVAFDTWESGGGPDRIYVAFENTGNRLVSVDMPNLEDGLWHTATVVFAAPLITVTLDGSDVITGAVLPGYVPFAGYFGFSAATGGATNEQRLDDIQVYALGLAAYGRLWGYVTDDDTGAPLEATVTVSGVGSVNTDPADGSYELYLEAGSYVVTASLDGYFTATAAVDIVSGQDTRQDFVLVYGIAFDPSPLHVFVDWQSTYQTIATLTNRLPGDYDFEFSELLGGFVPSIYQALPVYTPPPIVQDTGPQLEGRLTDYASSAFPLPDSGSGQAPVAPARYSGIDALVYYGDRATFDSDFPGLPLEDFEEGNVAPGGLAECPAPLDSNSDNACFSPGDILEGIMFQDNPGPSGDGLVLVGADYAGLGNTKNVVANYFVESYDIFFTERVFAVGMDLISYGADTVNITMYGPGGAVIGTTTASATPAGSFWGVYSDEAITRINIASPANEAEGVDNIAFGGQFDVPWFGQYPVSGTVPASDTLTADMIFTATYDVGVDQPGDYYATLIVDGDPKLKVPVTMTVLPAVDMGKIEGAVLDNCTTEPVEAHIAILNGDPITETWSDPDTGDYSAWLASGTYDLVFSATDYLPYTGTVDVVAGMTVTLDVDLLPDRPCIEVDPVMFEVWVLTGTLVYSHPPGLDIINNGGQALNFEIIEMDGGYIPAQLSGWRPAPLQGMYNPDAVADVVGGSQDSVPASAPAASPTPAQSLDNNLLDMLYDNGPLVTHPGGGSGGADASALQTALGMSTYGFGHQFANSYRVADDFEITDPDGWKIDTITFFAYQTGSPTDPSPITGVYYQIWDGSPDDPASNVIFGDLVTNRLDNTVWSNIYRVRDNDLLGTQRPIMANTATADVMLPPGTYWIEWMTDGSLTSGPWAPPISILGETTTGNALQYISAWAAVLDTGTNTPQGMPFIIEGDIVSGDVPWIWEDPMSGTVPADTSFNVDIAFSTYNDYPTATVQLPLGTYTATLLVTNNATEGTQEVLAIMHIAIPPTATFETNSPVCLGETMLFTNSTTPGIPPETDYLWAFGDGMTSTLEHPTHLYGAVGSYTATLEACNDAGCDITFDVVEVLPLPEAGFTYVVNELEVTFTNTSSNADNYLWEFGDGVTSTVEHPVHTYAAEGSYTVTLWASGPCGTDMFVDTVTVGLAPMAGFSHNAPVCLGQAVTFTNTTTGTLPIAYLWDLDDGYTSTLEHPTHTYALAGSYSVTLEATNDFGMDVASDVVEIWALPLAAFTSTVDGAVVTFTNLSAGADSYLWDLGDGIGTSTETHPVYTYAQDGSYTVTLSISGPCGEDETAMVVVIETCVGAALIAVEVDPPAPVAGEAVTFTATATGTAPLSFDWDLGDGTMVTATGAVETHAYTAAGSYTVTVMVSNACGEDEIAVQVVVVETCVGAALLAVEVEPPAPVAGEAVTFTATATAPLSFDWDFGDGSVVTGTGVVESHTYTAAGSYTVTVTVSNACGEEDIVFALTVEAVGYRIYLPLVTKAYLP